MGRASIKENKDEYQLTRERLGYTREEAAELLNVSESKLERMEDGHISPYDVMDMAEKYNEPNLCSYYCMHDCPIGIGYVPKIEVKDLPTVTIEILTKLNKLNTDKDRLLEISEDGQITEDELDDYARIEENLDKMELAIAALKQWVQTAQGKCE